MLENCTRLPFHTSISSFQEKWKKRQKRGKKGNVSGARDMYFCDSLFWTFHFLRQTNKRKYRRWTWTFVSSSALKKTSLELKGRRDRQEKEDAEKRSSMQFTRVNWIQFRRRERKGVSCVCCTKHSLESPTIRCMNVLNVYTFGFANKQTRLRWEKKRKRKTGQLLTGKSID